MNQRRVAFTAVFIAAAVFLWLSAAARSHNAARAERTGNVLKIGFQPGEYAADFELRSPDGHSVRLSGLRGEPVLLNFWATWCAPCRVEMPWLAQLDQRYRAQGVQIVGVSLDDAGAERDVTTFARDKGVRYTVLLGNSSVADAYGGVRFMPQSFFIDRDGKVTKTVIGLTGKQDLDDGVKALLTASDIASQLTPGGRH